MLLGEVNQGGLLKPYVNELRALLAMLRLRLFETLALLPPNCLEANFAALLRLLVSGFISFYFFNILWTDACSLRFVLSQNLRSYAFLL